MRKMNEKCPEYDRTKAKRDDSNGYLKFLKERCPKHSGSLAKGKPQLHVKIRNYVLTWFSSINPLWNSVRFHLALMDRMTENKMLFNHGITFVSLL